MEKILYYLISILLGIVLFTASSAFRIFQINFIALIGTSLLYFLIGLCLHSYFNEPKKVYPFFATTVIMSFGILFLPYISAMLFISITGILNVVNLSLGYYYSSFSKMIKYTIPIIMIALISYLSFSYFPKNVAQKRIESYSKLNNKPFVEFMSQVTLKDINNSLVKSYFQKDTIYLLEFFFRDCAPCRMKEKILPLIASTFINQPFKIVYVDNGKIDNFQTFTEGVNKKLYAENFYDEKNMLIQNLGIQSFPLEIILDKKGDIRHTYNGYSFDDDNEYFKITTKKIKDLLNE